MPVGLLVFTVQALSAELQTIFYGQGWGLVFV